MSFNNKLLLVALFALILTAVNCKAGHGDGSTPKTVSDGPVDRDKLTADDYKKLTGRMAEHVAENEPKIWLVMVIFLSPLFVVIASLLIMS